MPSLARSLYDSHATPTLYSYFANDRVLLDYTIGDTQVAGIVGIIRDRQIAMDEDPLGDTIKQDRRSIVICSDPTSPYKGVAEPQLKAIWTIHEEDGTDTTWGVDPSIGRGVEALSESLILIHLVRMHTVSKNIPNYRVG
jgi:hypothetical protein